MKSWIFAWLLAILSGGILTGEEPVRADLCIYGGTSAGVVAAVQGAREGLRVVIVEPGQHLGGMCVEGLGGTDIDNQKNFQNSPAVGGLALEFYRRISVRYGREREFLDALESRTKKTTLWRFEPHVAEAEFDAWVAEHGIRVLRGARLATADGVTKEGARIRSLTLENGEVVEASVFLDCTCEGDLLAQSGIEFSLGREGNARYGETKNGIRGDTTHNQFDRCIDPYVVPGEPASGLIFGVGQPDASEAGQADESIQGFCFRLCLTRDPANRIEIECPKGYDPARYELQRRYLAAGGVITAPGTSVPNGKTDPGSWHYLAGNFTGWNHRYPVATQAEREAMLRESRDWIQGLYWFMAHDPAVPEEQRAKWASWGLCKDEFMDNGGWPRTFYVRNGRRMIGDFVLTEAHFRKENPAPVDDSVGMIWWPPDLHHARRIVKDGCVWNEGAVFDASADPDWIPVGIPYRALVPKESECVNLLSPTCPSSSYVAYGAYRIEFTFMTAGQSAASVAALAIREGCSVQRVPYGKLRERLLQDGQVLIAR